MAWSLCPVIHAAVSEATLVGGVFTLPRADGGFTCTLDGTMTVQTDDATSYTYRDHGVLVTPKNPGEIIIATFERLDLPPGSAVLVYDNVPVGTIMNKFGTSGASTGTYRYFPDGWSTALQPDSECITVQSTASDGSLSIGMHTSSWTTGTNGIKMTIVSAVPKDMEYVSAEYVPNTGLTRGVKNAVLGTFNIQTEGLNSPLTLDKLTFDISALTAQGITETALYAGSEKIAEAEGTTIIHTPATNLSSGKNQYTLRGTLPENLTGILGLPSAMSVIVSGQEHEITIDGVPMVNNIILMPSDATTYIIDEATRFFDDGGAEGKISEKFTGTVTFAPSKPDHKIRIDFDEFNIFYNTSAASVGNEDVFKFYNGRTPDESNLIRCLTDEPAIIKSTADDGSITVTFASRTGYPTDGWNAVVSQFIPGDMTISSVSTIQSEECATASSFDIGVVLATVRIDAVNTLNPLNAECINFDLSGSQDIQAINIYALGEKNNFSTSFKVGSLETIQDGNVSISLKDAELKEGQNYMAIAADINGTASNGTILSVRPSNIIIGGEAMTFAESASSGVTIENVFNHREGTEVRNIHDVWQFNSTPDPISPTKYLLRNADCTVTFIPQEGAVAILEFSDFDVYYYSGSYGTRALFKVYSGHTADPSNILWELDTNGGKPSGKLKSTAEDGSITVVFNANTTSSYYAGKGWKATVTPFINHDMTVKTVEVSQPYTGPIMAGAKAEDILDINILTEGTLDQRILKGLTVNLKDSRTNADRAAVLVRNTEGDNAEIGSIDINDSDEVTIPCEYNLAEGDNTFVVALDINSEAVPDAKIDARVVSVITDREAIAVKDGDPDGHRIVKYQYLMKPGDTELTITNAIHFYDDGGSDGILSKDGLKGNVTFIPADPTKTIRATVVSYKTAATGTIDFYNGHSAEGISLGQCKQSAFPALPIVSAAQDGSLTLNVNCSSYSYGTYDGWDIIIEQYTPSDLYVKDATAENIADAHMVRGIKDAPFSKIIFSYEGDRKTLGIKELNAHLSGTGASGVAEAKLWYTAKSDGFAPLNLVATAVPGADGEIHFACENPAAADVLGDYYYWVTLSLNPEAIVGNEVILSIASAEMTDGNTIGIVNNSEQITTVKPGFAGGEFIIGKSADSDYATFKEAIEAMGDAIEGPVKFLVEPGTYAEDISVDGIKGTSSVNTITFTSQTGNAADVIITGKGYSDGGYGAAKYGIVNIKNTDWLTFDSMTLNGKTSGSTEYPYYVNYVEASRHNTLSNCVMTASTSTSYSGLNMVYATCSDPVENGRNPDYLTIEGNDFTGGYIAIYMQGSYGYVAYEHMKGLAVKNNRFTDVGSKAIYPYQIEDVEISGNVITAGTAVTKTSYYAIDAVRLRGVIDIFNNTITNNQTVYSSGIYLRSGAGGDTDRNARIYNNAISLTASPNASSSGVQITSECNNIDLCNNTVNIEGAGGHGIYVSGSARDLDNLKISNNLVRVNVSGTGDAFAFRLATTDLTDRLKFHSNAFFSSSKISNLGEDAESWATATGDLTLINEEALFNSAGDLHLKASGSLVSAIPIDYVITDLDGNPRSVTPTIGAYEFTEMNVENPVLAEEYPKITNITETGARVITSWNVAGQLHYTVTSAEMEAPSNEALLEAAAIDVAARADAALNLSGLTSNTAYRVYFALEAVNGKISETHMAEFSTLRHIEPLEVELEMETEPSETGGAEVVIYPYVDGGDEPYTYCWTNKMGEVVGTDGTLAVMPTNPDVYTLTVTSSDGQTAFSRTLHKVYGGALGANFTDNYLEEESHWSGAGIDGIYSFPFVSGSFVFSNTSIPEYNFWGGFTFANYSSNRFIQTNPDQFHNIVGNAVMGSHYAVCYTMGARCNIEVLKNREGAELDHVYITNTAYFENHATIGDSFGGPFKSGDYHKVIFTSDDPDGIPVEVYLADFRDGMSEIVYGWQTVDLKPLGRKVKNITVTTESSTPYAPAYFALDNLEYTDNLTGLEEAEGVNPDEVALVRVVSAEGVIVIENKNGTVDTDGLTHGIYFIEYVLNDGRSMTEKRLVK